jgi:hypothetical protein
LEEVTLKSTVAIVLGALAISAPSVRAGVYTDDLTKCLVAATSKEDRLALVKWIYAAMSKHQAVSAMTKVSDAEITSATKAAGQLFMSLLTEKCVEPTRSALKYEGALALQSSFQVLGQVAMTELLTDPSVGQVMAQLDQFVDKTKLEALPKDTP